MLTSFKRVIKFGWQGFCRNKGLSAQVVFIMGVAVFVVTTLFIFRDVGSVLLKKAQKRVDIAVYFKKGIEEREILGVQDELTKLSSYVASIDYVSKEGALKNFLAKHRDDPLWMQALEEVEDNPLLASLNIKAKGPGQYAQISRFLEADIFNGLIERISYRTEENKRAIERLFTITSNIKTVGIGLSVLICLLVVLLTFNTVKLTILTSREEISTMRLVGAANWFIRGPFLIQGMFYGLFAVFIVDALFFAGFFLFNTNLAIWFLGIDFLNYFKENFLLVLAIQLASAGLFGVICTFFAVRKYLKV